MKMISRTSITSTIGVTLISAIGERRARRWPPRMGDMGIRRSSLGDGKGNRSKAEPGEALSVAPATES